eukprot:scaffold1240_cov101-Isochrysis_galbana.AAC.2
MVSRVLASLADLAAPAVSPSVLPVPGRGGGGGGTYLLRTLPMEVAVLCKKRTSPVSGGPSSTRSTARRSAATAAGISIVSSTSMRESSSASRANADSSPSSASAGGAAAFCRCALVPRTSTPVRKKDGPAPAVSSSSASSVGSGGAARTRTGGGALRGAEIWRRVGGSATRAGPGPPSFEGGGGGGGANETTFTPLCSPITYAKSPDVPPRRMHGFPYSSRVVSERSLSSGRRSASSAMRLCTSESVAKAGKPPSGKLAGSCSTLLRAMDREARRGRVARARKAPDVSSTLSSSESRRSVWKAARDSGSSGSLLPERSSSRIAGRSASDRMACGLRPLKERLSTSKFRKASAGIIMSVKPLQSRCSSLSAGSAPSWAS